MTTNDKTNNLKNRENNNKNINMEEDQQFLKNNNSLKYFFSKWEYRPVPDILTTIVCFFIFFLIFLILGILILYQSSTIKSVSIRYDNISECNKYYDLIYPDENYQSNKLAFEKDNEIYTSDKIINLNDKVLEIKKIRDSLGITLKYSQCLIQVTLFETFKAPVYIYYELNNFYQNHRKFINSYSIKQLKGELLSTDDINENCSPIVTVKDLGIKTTIGGNVLEDSAPANPCGLYPRSFFNDTYELYSIKKENKKIFINETGIAYKSDKTNRFKAPINYENIQWLNVTDEHFMVWMRPAGTNNFKKLWGRIDEDMHPGNYSLLINNKYNVSYFGGEKSVIFSTSSILGGRNTFLGTLYIILSVVCLLSVGLFGMSYYTNSKVKTS